MISQNRLKEVMQYDANSGVFTRKSDGKRQSRIWKPRNRNLSYGILSIDGKQYYAHRMAWLYVHGTLPSCEIDHISGDGTDNRIANLRIATRGQNATNALAQKSSKTKLRGVFMHKPSGRYRAQICKNLKTKSLGYFDSKEAAHAAYLAAARQIHGEFVRQ